ncbi:MAG: hypothetical protein ACAI44_18880 [Candidatus Sericytochromatia bacterium]
METRQQRRYGAWLWILLGFFCFRVSAQLIQFFAPVPWLPPFEAWQSGLVPYASLVVGQAVIILIYGRTALAFARGQIQARLGSGRLLLGLGSLYALSMLVRYIIRMSLYPQERWAGGCLPIFFHILLASFLLIWGSYHWRYGEVNSEQRTVNSEEGKKKGRGARDEGEDKRPFSPTVNC